MLMLWPVYKQINHYCVGLNQFSFILPPNTNSFCQIPYNSTLLGTKQTQFFRKNPPDTHRIFSPPRPFKIHSTSLSLIGLNFVRLFGPPSEQVKANSGLVRLQDNYAYIILPFLGFALLWFKGDCFWLVRVSSRWPLSQKLKANDGFVRLRDIHAYCIYIILTVLGLCSSLFWRGLFLKKTDMAT